MIVRDLQFFGRAEHALAFNAAELANFDQERFAIFAGRQLGSHQSARHANAHARIGRTTDNIEPFALPDIHLAHAQTVGVGVLHRFLDLANHDAGKGRGHRLQLFHFETGHGQGVGQLLGSQRGVAELAQPGFRKLHRLDSFE